MTIRISDCKRDTEMHKENKQRETERDKTQRGRKGGKEGNTVAAGYNPSAKLEP